MKKNFIAILSAAVITAGAVGGVAFASGLNDNSENDTQVSSVFENYSPLKNTNFNQNSANNPQKDTYQDMVKLMRENGFKDAARYMQTGDFDGMNDFMSNLSQEDFDQMLEIMNDSSYEYMGKMMESLGRDGMIQMHNSMGSMMSSF